MYTTARLVWHNTGDQLQSVSISTMGTIKSAIHQAIGCPKSSHIHVVLILLYEQLCPIITIFIFNIIIILP